MHVTSKGQVTFHALSGKAWGLFLLNLKLIFYNMKKVVGISQNLKPPTKKPVDSERLIIQEN